MTRRIARWLGLSLGLAIILLALFVIAIRQSGLPHGAGSVIEVLQQDSREAGRLIRHITIEDSALGAIELVVSLPGPLPDRPLPIVVVLGGLGSGLKTIRHLPPAGDNLVVGYDWPIPRKLPRGPEALWRVPALYPRVLSVPGQIAAAVEWVAAQPWADKGRISLLGFSLGALAAPAAQRLLEARGLTVGWTVIAYGGANLGELVRHHPRVGPDWARPLLGRLAGWLFRPLDPAAHLPHLSGRFLFIGGAEDALIPEASAKLMRDLTPEPKTIVLLDGQHVGVGKDQDALLGQILEVTEDWLMDQGAINPR